MNVPCRFCGSIFMVPVGHQTLLAYCPACLPRDKATTPPTHKRKPRKPRKKVNAHGTRSPS